MNTLFIAGLFVACLMVVSEAAGPDLAKKIKNVKENSELTEEQKQAVIARLTEGSSGAAAERVGAKAAPSEGAAARRPAVLERTAAHEKTEDDDE